MQHFHKRTRVYRSNIYIRRATKWEAQARRKTATRKTRSARSRSAGRWAWASWSSAMRASPTHETAFRAKFCKITTLQGLRCILDIYRDMNDLADFGAPCLESVTDLSYVYFAKHSSADWVETSTHSFGRSLYHRVQSEVFVQFLPRAALCIEAGNQTPALQPRPSSERIRPASTSVAPPRIPRSRVANYASPLH
jgi:hypothetical protein